MGKIKDISIVLHNEFPDNDNQDKLLDEFYSWVKNENMIFEPIMMKTDCFADLCNNQIVNTITVLEYWCQHIKKGIHNGEGFVIKV